MHRENKLTEDHFLIVIEGECQNEDKKIEIITSIKELIYRVEVKEEGMLIDAIEVVCDTLRYDPHRETLFKEKYTQAHQKVYTNYCPSVKSDTAPIELRLGKKEEEQEEEEEESPYEVYVPVKKEKEKRKIMDFSYRLKSKNILMLSLVAIVLLFVLLGRFLMCSPTMYHYYFSNEKEKITYLEKTEPYCHHLEESCYHQVDKSAQASEYFSQKRCKIWCEREIMTQKVCRRFLPYFETESTVNRKSSLSKPIQTVSDNTEKYSLLPKEIRILQMKPFALKVKNHHKVPLSIRLVGLDVEGTQNDEIVQLVKGISALSVGVNKSKAFSFFLERSYYRQFAKGVYQGSFRFRIDYEGEDSVEILKAFSFEVE